VRLALVTALAVLVGWSAPVRADAPQSATRNNATATAAPTRATRTSTSRAVREAMKPRYKRDASGELVPDVRAEAAIIFSPQTGRVLWEDHAHDVRSIASITKVMTVLVFLESGPDLDRTVTVTRADLRRASTTYLRVNEKLTLANVLNVTLVASDNAAARVLARSAGYPSLEAFLARMNEKAVELGLEETSFTDPSGLDAGNISSAYDVSRLITFAARDERIARIMQQTEYSFGTSRRKSVRVRNTNKLIGQLDVVGGKTGFIRRAGYCLATLLRLPEGQDVAVVVLGARSNLGRFWETRHLFNWLKDRPANSDQ
jgi:D-alanyl-D-alanine endopeptidase (penicillin-binding protein 7)